MIFNLLRQPSFYFLGWPTHGTNEFRVYCFYIAIGDHVDLSIGQTSRLALGCCKFIHLGLSMVELNNMEVMFGIIQQEILHPYLLTPKISTLGGPRVLLAGRSRHYSTCTSACDILHDLECCGHIITSKWTILPDPLNVVGTNHHPLIRCKFWEFVPLVFPFYL